MAIAAKVIAGTSKLITTPGQMDLNTVTARVNGLTPKGKTPLSDAVRQAAEQLKFTENKATVILLSDGVETCNADPCAVATELEGLGIDFTTHVIGFDIKTEEDKAQLVCLAENTGGQYFDAENTAGLERRQLMRRLKKLLTSRLSRKSKTGNNPAIDAFRTGSAQRDHVFLGDK